MNDKPLWQEAACSVFNLDRANYYLKQVSGNDQEISIPAPFHIYFDIWELLFFLVEAKVEEQKSSCSEDPAPIKDHFSFASMAVADQLSDLFLGKQREEIVGDRISGSVNPAHLSLSSVAAKAKNYAQALEQLPDVSSRFRADVIRNKHYLSDDYEDPRFHLDWSLAQLFSPVAMIVRMHIEGRMDGLVIKANS